MKKTILAAFVCLSLCSISLAEEPKHQGRNVKGAIGWNPFSFDDSDDDDFDVAEAIVRFGLNGGIGYRGKGRWESRFNLDISSGQVGRRASNIKSPDTAIEIGVEPIIHFLKNPSKWDPYLIITSVGFMHLFRNSTSGITFGFPGLDLQHHVGAIYRW